MAWCCLNPQQSWNILQSCWRSTGSMVSQKKSMQSTKLSTCCTNTITWWPLVASTSCAQSSTPFAGGEPFDIEALKAGLAKTKAEQYQQLEDILVKNGGFVAGPTPTIADIHFWVDTHQMTKLDAPADDYTTFHIYDFDEHPAVQKWIKTVKEAVYDEALECTTRPIILAMAEKTEHQFRLLQPVFSVWKRKWGWGVSCDEMSVNNNSWAGSSWAGAWVMGGTYFYFFVVLMGHGCIIGGMMWLKSCDDGGRGCGAAKKNDKRPQNPHIERHMSSPVSFEISQCHYIGVEMVEFGVTQQGGSTPQKSSEM